LRILCRAARDFLVVKLDFSMLGAKFFKKVKKGGE